MKQRHYLAYPKHLMLWAFPILSSSNYLKTHCSHAKYKYKIEFYFETASQILLENAYLFQSTSSESLAFSCFTFILIFIKYKSKLNLSLVLSVPSRPILSSKWGDILTPVNSGTHSRAYTSCYITAGLTWNTH